MDLLADDLAALMAPLDLKDLTLVGHSLGCGEIVRYLSRYGTGRVSGAVCVAPQLPLLVKTADNPDGVDEVMLDAMLAQLEADVRLWCVDNAPPFFGVNQPVPPGVLERTVEQVVDVPVQTLVATQRMGARTDYRAELVDLALPVLFIHGDADVSAPIDLTAGEAHRDSRCRARALRHPFRRDLWGLSGFARKFVGWYAAGRVSSRLRNALRSARGSRPHRPVR